MPETEIHKIIATINPDKYYDEKEPGALRKFKELKEKEGFKAALEKAKAKSDEDHQIIYDSASETLEPVYFWLLDKTNDFFGNDVEKFVDNFVSSPGSGHFSELMGKATKMQEEAMKAMGMVNQLIKAIINLVYDLKNFETRLDEYTRASSKDTEQAKAGIYGLKQIWMDNVDIKRGNTSIKAMSMQFDYVTLIDAFMVANSLADVKKIDINERVRKILEARVAEFLDWKSRSEKELRQRYEMERTYLKSEIASLKLYTRWAKPYLKAAAELEQLSSGRKPDIVKAFNTIRLELALLGKTPVDIEKAIVAKQLSPEFRRIKDRFKRKYYACIVIDLYFRGIPQRIGQGYVYGGRTEVSFKAYALNDDEIKMLGQKFDETDVADALKLVEVATGESLGQLQGDIEKYLAEKPKEEEKPASVNPFTALFKSSKKPEAPETKKEGKKEEKKVLITEIEPDTYQEKLLRQIAEKSAKESCFKIFDIYKKAHGMASHISPEDLL